MNASPRFHKTRIAPTPSGYLHRGNALSFLITAALAKTTGARLLLRIDDLDQPRVRPGYLQNIFDTLRLLNISWDEGPRSTEEHLARYSQVHRLPLYRAALKQLRDEGQLFACTCSRATILKQNAQGIYPGTCCKKNIPLDAEGVSWRLRTNATQPIPVKNIDGSVTFAALAQEMQYFIVRKKDGMPAYQLTSLVDDLHFGVDLIVRGADLWPSTLAQLYLAPLLAKTTFTETTFYHHPLLTDANGQKLSKSTDAASLKTNLTLDDLPQDLLTEIRKQLR